jgi:glutathione S-transferase
MLKLCGFSASNYYNVVKLQLLEKGVPFEEELVWTGGGEKLTSNSPMAKVPFLVTPEGSLTETTVICEYIEQAYPATPMIPREPFAAAKVRELVRYLELHLELVARELYPQAYFGGSISDATKDRARKLLVKGTAAYGRLAQFAPYQLGESFTLADCAAIVHLPVIAGAAKLVLEEDLFAALPVRDYLKAMAGRETVAKVNADRKSNTEAMMAKMAAARKA